MNTPTTYAVKVESGHAKLYDAKTGFYKRSLATDVTSAQITGDLVQVTKKNGRVEIYDANTGFYVRSL